MIKNSDRIESNHNLFKKEARFHYENDIEEQDDEGMAIIDQDD